MIREVDHVGVAVESLESGLRFWAETLGLEVLGISTVAEEQVKVALLAAGKTRIELLEPTAGDSSVARFVARRGPGLHHVTLAVADLEAMLERLRGRGVTVLGDGARGGAEGRRVAFLHPRSTGGVLVELVEQRQPEAPAADAGFELAPGSAVLLNLRDPQEKLWGVLRRLDVRGAVVEGIDLSSFDDWVAQIECGEGAAVGPSVLFVPMARVDKIRLDRRSGELPSLAERFQRRIGRSVQDVLDESPGS